MILNRIVIKSLYLYKIAISPMIGQNCRYYPTCSSYAVSCFEKFSFLRALWYSLKRIIKCNPWSKGGYDPIPNK